MKKIALTAFAASLLIAAPAASQTPQGGLADQKFTSASSVQFMFDAVRGYLIRSAEEAPDSVYSFRPTADVRTFGQLLAHIADAHHAICGAAAGAPVQPPGLERTATSRAQIIEGLKASYEPCEKAFAQGDEVILEPLTLFGMRMSRLGALTLAATHDWEHYGNLVTYMRMNGMVPPSSQR
jgi:uncharacterized damage-inducible protein DinB